MKKFEVEGALLVHGIWLASRHGRLNEVREMIDFTALAKTQGVAKYIAAVWYDSSASVVEIECHITPEPCDPVHRAVENVALRTLTTFRIKGDTGDYQWGRRKPRPRAGAPIPQRWVQWSRR